MQFGVGDDGQIIFKTNAVREPPHRTARADEVPEFPGAVQRGRIVINVIVDVRLVCVGGNEKGVFALCPAHCRFIADAVRLLRRDLPGFERLADLIAKHFRIPPLLGLFGKLSQIVIFEYLTPQLNVSNCFLLSTNTNYVKPKSSY